MNIIRYINKRNKKVEITMGKGLTVTSTDAFQKNPNNIWTIDMDPLDKYYDATVSFAM